MLLPLLLAAAAAIPACPRSFETVDRIVSGVSVGSAVYGDFNEDGRTDVAYTTGDDTFVLAGRGNGVFEPISRTDVTRLMRAPVASSVVAATDTNNDRHLDLVYVRAGIVWTAFGRGDATFETPRETRLALSSDGWLQLDFDHDGLLDFVDMNGAAGEVTFIRSAGDGRFVEAGRYKTSPILQSFAIGDFDGDGAVDIADMRFESDVVRLVVAWNDGAYHFTTTSFP